MSDPTESCDPCEASGSIASNVCCLVPGCSKVCLTKKGLDQHQLIHRDDKTTRKRKGAVKQQVGFKRKCPGKVKSASARDAIPEGVGNLDDAMEDDITLDARHEAPGEEANASTIGSEGEAAEADDSADRKLGVPHDGMQKPKRKYTKGRKNMVSIPKRKRVTVLVEDASIEEVNLLSAEETSFDKSETPCQDANQKNSGLPVSPCKKVTVIVEQVKSNEDDEVVADQPEQSEGCSEEGSTINVIFTDIQDVASTSYWLDDITSLDIEDLNFVTVPETVHEPTREELLKEDVISSVVHDVMNNDEAVFHDVHFSNEVPAEDDNLTETDILCDYDWLLLDPISEEDSHAVDMETNEREHSYLGFEDQLIVNLTLLLPEEWVLRKCRHIVTMSLLSPFENTCVVSSISWNGKSIKIYVHNKEVGKEHFVWNSVNQMDRSNHGDVSDHLAKLAYIVQHSMICKGVRLYSEVWQKSAERGEGEIEKDIYQESAIKISFV